jgi:ADP-ribosylglycohydrolase
VTGFEQFRRVGIGSAGQITDDTQMTLFTAEGLLWAYRRGSEKGICDPVGMVHQAYLRWLISQGVTPREKPVLGENGPGLLGVPELHARRAPGNTCLTALGSGDLGRPDKPINESKGCGGVMRAAPAGLLPLGSDPFERGVQIAAITHGHPSGYLAAGCLAQLVHDLAKGADLPVAVDHVRTRLQTWPGHTECLAALDSALALWQDTRRSPSAEGVEGLGAGWVAEEALAIGVYCALAAGEDFARGVLLAVNHSGDSDSTGSITGNILGVLLGEQAISADWLAVLEIREVIARLARDLSEAAQVGSA